MKKSDLKKIFDEAKRKELDLIYELTTPPEREKTYFLIQRDMIKDRLDFFSKEYNDDLELNANNNIRITNIKKINLKELFNEEEN